MVFDGFGDNVNFFWREIVINFRVFAEKFSRDELMAITIDMFAEVMIGGNGVD